MHNPTLVGDIAAANQLQPTTLLDKELELLLDFLHTLTDPDAIGLRSDIPMQVPSGLPLADNSLFNQNQGLSCF